MFARLNPEPLTLRPFDPIAHDPPSSAGIFVAATPACALTVCWSVGVVVAAIYAASALFDVAVFWPSVANPAKLAAVAARSLVSL
jgi:hypothetical protein